MRRPPSERSSLGWEARARRASIWCRTVTPTLTAEEIRDANTRYHDVAADHYDSKWGIDFAELGLSQVSAKVRKALGREPGHFARSLEIGSGTGYFTPQPDARRPDRRGDVQRHLPGHAGDARGERASAWA